MENMEIAVAAIQELHDQLKGKDAEIATLEKRLARLETLLAATGEGGAP
jgi:hypothetical protein